MITMKHTGFALFLLLSQSALANKPNIQSDPSTFEGMARTAAQNLDSGNYQKVWKGATQYTQNVIDEKTFTAQVTSNKASVGKVQQRSWRSITRVQLMEDANSKTPANYVNVNYDSTFSEGKKGNELVSFRQDIDGKWRFSGYIATLNQ